MSVDDPDCILFKVERALLLPVLKATITSLLYVVEQKGPRLTLWMLIVLPLMPAILAVAITVALMAIMAAHTPSCAGRLLVYPVVGFMGWQLCSVAFYLYSRVFVGVHLLM